MANRIERLLGYQLCRKANQGNNFIYDASCQLRGLRPIHLTPLVVWDQGDMEQAGPGRAATISDIKGMVSTERACINVEIRQRLDGFLAGYTDTTTITNGLAAFNTPKSCIDQDRGEIKVHDTSLESVIALVDTEDGLRDNGNLLSLYQETVELHVKPEMLPMDEQRVTTYQGLLNAMAFELRGICSYTGDAKYKTVEAIKEVIGGRLTTANLFWENYMWETVENNAMRTVQLYVENNLADCANKKDLELLGDYVDTHVEQMPVVRRWWNYGV